LLNVIPMHAAPRDDLGGEGGEPAASEILGGTAEDDAEVGIAARDHAREPESELIPTPEAANPPWMIEVIASDPDVEIRDDIAMGIIRDFSHFEHSPS